MYRRTATVIVGLIASGLAPVAHAGSMQIGDFRLQADAYATETAFDPGFGGDDSFKSRGPDADGDNSNGIQESPVKIFSQLTGGSQQASGVIDPATDVRLITYSAATQIRNLSRYTPSVDGISGPARVGMVQWNFDLTDLETYLADNSLELTALDLGLNISVSDFGKKYGFYLSYTNPAESITQASIDNSTVGYDADGNGGAGGLNWTNFYFPTVGASAGTIVNGTHKVLVSDYVGILDLSESLLDLYDAGVRNFNLQLVASDYWAARQINIDEGSGLSIDTVAAGIPGDLNGDGYVGLDDLQPILDHWNQDVTPGDLTAGDVTNDGYVGLDDLQPVLDHWNESASPAVSVPEPAALTLMVLSGAALLRRRA